MKTTNWNELAKELHASAVKKGFLDKEYSDEHYLMLVITEISEAVEADRKGIRANLKDYKTFLKESGQDFNISGFKWSIKDSTADELADVVIRLLDLAGARGYDLSKINEIEISIIDKFKGLSFTQIAYSFCAVIVNSYDSTQKVIMDGIYFVTMWCQYLGIDLEWHIDQKMKYNQTREPMHGKKY